MRRIYLFDSTKNKTNSISPKERERPLNLKNQILRIPIEYLKEKKMKEMSNPQPYLLGYDLILCKVFEHDSAICNPTEFVLDQCLFNWKS